MAARFHGQTVVWRGPWRMDIPLDFHIEVNPEEDIGLIREAAMAIAQFLSEEYVHEQEEAAADSSGSVYSEDEDD